MKAAEAEVCVTFGADIEKIVHASVSGPIGRLLLKDVSRCGVEIV